MRSSHRRSIAAALLLLTMNMSDAGSRPPPELSGTWMRDDGLMLVLAHGGRLAVLGDPAVTGGRWEREGQDLVLVTSSDGESPQTSRQVMRHLDDAELVLEGSGPAGRFERTADARLVHGTAVYYVRIAIPVDAKLEVTLHEAGSDDRPGRALTRFVDAQAGTHHPMAFELFCPQPASGYALTAALIMYGRPMLLTPQPVPVSFDAPVQLVLVPASGGRGGPVKDEPRSP